MPRNETTSAPAVDPVSLSDALSAGKKIPPQALHLLMQDHREVLGLFAAFEAAPDPAIKLKLARRICMDLKVHMQFEEELFYTAAGDALEEAGQETDSEELIDDALDDHEDAKDLIAHLDTMTAVDEAFIDLVSALRAAIEQHVTVEETELFPKVRQTALDLYGLGGPMVIRRAELFSTCTGKPLPRSVRPAPEDAQQA